MTQAIERLANRKFEEMLKAAEEYYWNDNSIMSDFEYDDLTKEVYLLKDQITHPKKHLVDFDQLRKCSSLFYISRNKYHEGV